MADAIPGIALDNDILRVAVPDELDRLGEVSGMDDELVFLAIVDQNAQEKAGFFREILLALEFSEREGKRFDIFCGIFQFLYLA